MKTIKDIIIENLPELTFTELLTVERRINEQKKQLIKDMKGIYVDGGYKVRKTLINSGLTHSQACKFIKDYMIK